MKKKDLIYSSYVLSYFAFLCYVRDIVIIVPLEILEMVIKRAIILFPVHQKEIPFFRNTAFRHM